MNANQPNRSASSSSAATARARQSALPEPARAPAESPSFAADGHLAELVRNLCALAADSPERQAKIQNLMRAYATGNLQMDAEATASAIIGDAFGSRWVRR